MQLCVSCAVLLQSGRDASHLAWCAAAAHHSWIDAAGSAYAKHGPSQPSHDQLLGPSNLWPIPTEGPPLSGLSLLQQLLGHSRRLLFLAASTPTKDCPPPPQPPPGPLYTARRLLPLKNVRRSEYSRMLHLQHAAQRGSRGQGDPANNVSAVPQALAGRATGEHQQAGACSRSCAAGTDRCHGGQEWCSRALMDKN